MRISSRWAIGWLKPKCADSDPRVGKLGDPCVMVIFGAAGDLTRRMLIPALYNLAAQQVAFQRICGSRSGPQPDDRRRFAQKVIEGHSSNLPPERVDPALWEDVSFAASTTSRGFRRPAIYPKLKERLPKIDQEHSTHGNYFFYLATAPNYFGDDRRATCSNRPDGRRQRPLAAGDHRKAFRTRSGLRQGAQPATA